MSLKISSGEIDMTIFIFGQKYFFIIVFIQDLKNG